MKKPDFAEKSGSWLADGLTGARSARNDQAS